MVAENPESSYSRKRAGNEQIVADQIAPQIPDYTVLCDRINEVVSAIVAEEPTGVARSVASLVVTRLVLRLLDDLRACVLLTARGYVLQAHGITAGVLEVATAAAYIGKNDERANKWVDHKPTDRTYPPRKAALREAVALFGGGPEHEAILTSQYEQACMSKHSNPHALTQIGLAADEYHVELMMGPYYSEDVVRVARRVLGQAARFVLIGAWAYTQYHILLEETKQRADVQVRGLEATLKALDLVEVERAAARRS
jgi:hypothetical protein